MLEISLIVVTIGSIDCLVLPENKPLPYFVMLLLCPGPSLNLNDLAT